MGTATHRRSEVALIVEVADATLASDRTFKKLLYAEAKIAVYWIVNLVDRRIEVHLEPTGAAERPTYVSRQDYGPLDEIPVVIEGREVGRIPVADLCREGPHLRSLEIDQERPELKIAKSVRNKVVVPSVAAWGLSSGTVTKYNNGPLLCNLPTSSEASSTSRIRGKSGEFALKVIKECMLCAQLENGSEEPGGSLKPHKLC